MVTLTRARPEAVRTEPTTHEPDDMSDNAHRQAIGYIGLALPFLLILMAGLRPTDTLERWRVLNSVSSYYYTSAVATFVGLLSALSLFLLTYRGYDNKFHWLDRLAGVVAGIAAFGVAFFPTMPPDGVTAPSWVTKTTGYLHYGSAAILFAMFAVFSIWLFRLKPEGKPESADKRSRNHIYLFSGLVIIAACAYTVYAGLNRKPIFLSESIALMAFAISWLTKGRARQSIARKLKRV
jgi:hypothetical protein